MDLNTLQRIKQWHVDHQRDHPVEYRAWEAMLTLWMIGWIGWIPALAFDALWTAPLLAASMFAPTLYITWRAREHRLRRLRCDWIDQR